MPAPGEGTVTVIVPVGTAQVGCVVTEAAGATVDTVTASVEAPLVPQPLDAVTDMLPAALPDVTVTDMVP
jgi:hypothetical protein